MFAANQFTIRRPFLTGAAATVVPPSVAMPCPARMVGNKDYLD